MLRVGERTAFRIGLVEKHDGRGIPYDERGEYTCTR
jgi:hypothetical protein